MSRSMIFYVKQTFHSKNEIMAIHSSSHSCKIFTWHLWPVRYIRLHSSLASCSRTNMSEFVVVQISCGRLRGAFRRSFQGYDYCSFKGIPYAKPPVGHLRFKDPLPVEPWLGVRNATEFGQSCIQSDRLSRNIQGSDDCLYLNVYVQSIRPKSFLPVMVFIHGGGFIFGSGDDLFYGPDYLLKKNIVLVTFNYRLGVFGFLNLGHKCAPGNQGLKDQVMLLRWVQENIIHFGGDPDNVTIFGESAGGSSVHYLTLSKLAKGLFHKAISQSGVACNPWACTSNKENAYALCKQLGSNSTNPEELVEFLRTLDCKKIIEAQRSLLSYKHKLYCTVTFGPGIDNKSEQPFMPIHPLKAMEEGVHVPFILGCNVHEGVVNISGIKDYMMDELERNFEKYLHSIHIDLLQRVGITPSDLKHLYYGDERISFKNIEKYINYCTDMHFLEGIHRVLSFQVKKSSTSTYFYRFTYDKEFSVLKSVLNVNLPGTGHFDEMQFLFSMRHGNYLKPGTTAHRISEQMTEMWVNFAKYGRPTPATSDLIPIYWQPITCEENFHTLNINEKLKMENTTSIENRLFQKKYMKNKL